ncbi:receptor-like protein Cf-9 homolog [Ziziphus jujuba]|uniref:Receptor-like protein Cf-9 homolog n=1 Tax=Ziziphus jujuba TaxID=326968 RepID=A0ABM3IPY7_ZIZJJ|nr:receptor-like protein Cf-9 homolog [Ziziphus jujuba]
MGWFSLLSLLFFLLPFSSFQTSSNVSSSSIIHHPSPLCHPYERSALIQFKNSFSVNNTIASDPYGCDGIDPPTISWAKNDASNCCAWRGVTCDEKAGHVIGLDLSCARLQGAFHSNSTLFFLRNLQSLYLSYNDFGGSTIPSEFGKFTNLEHLILSNSNFSGNVPPEISYLSKLVTLDLSLNNFHKLNVDTFTLKRIVTNLTNLEALSMDLVDMSSVSPVVLMNLSSSLINLTLSYCSLGGNLPADYIFHLPKLEMLFLGENENLTGSLFPKSNRNTSSPLKELDLFETKLSIDFPYLIQNFKYSLEYLYLGSCKILGWNPTLLANLTQISVLDLSSNNFGGEIPWSSLMHLERLISLDLSDNNFTGQLPEISSYNSTQLSFSYDNSSNSLTSGGPLPLELGVLDLSDNLLDGKIPGWLYSLKSLDYLDLSSNQFTGYIEEFQSHSLVRLNLSNNKLHGSLPSSIFQQVNLTFLDLSSNSLSGDVGINDFSKLKRLIYLSISKNQLGGKMPSSICDLNSLQYLDLSNNSLIGTVHPCLGNFSVNLLVLNLHINKLHGTIPLIFAKGNSLRNLNLNGNQLGGILPQSLVRCKKMEILDVGNNKMNDTFPYWLESLPMLQVLILRSNRFHGSIDVSPKTALPFQTLRIMDLSNNEFSGNLPTKYFKNLLAMMDAYSDQLTYMGEDQYYESTIVVIKGFLLEMERIQTMFTTIDLSKNNFVGEIPKLIGKLKSLKGLNFSHNKLTGPIPSTLENLSNLEWLDLSWNELVGEIPQQLTNMISLEVLNVSKNRLVGPIPSGKQFNTFDNTSYSENMGLCGFPLSKICGNNEAPQSPTTKFEEEGGYGFDWKIILVGYGCGIVIGVSLGYIVLSNEKFTLFLIKIGFSNLLYA